jgi:hypothetical protein
MWIQAPFDARTVDTLNRIQAGVLPLPVQPIACPHAHDGQHSRAGGYLGTLVAHRQGLVCPSCGYRQDWVARSVLEHAEREWAAHSQAAHSRMEKARQRALDDFGQLVREGSLVAQAMVESLQPRTAAARNAVRTGIGHSETALAA